MIRYLEHAAIDKTRWDASLESSYNGMVYGCSWFLDIVSPGWCALVMDDYAGLFPLTQRRKWGFAYLYQPAFTQQLGIFSNVPLDEEIFLGFLRSIPASYRLVEIQLNTQNRFQVASAGFMAHERVTHHLSLEADAPSLFSGYSENTRRNIRKSDISPAVFSTTNDVRPLVDLFIRNRGKDLDHLKRNDYEVFIRLCHEAQMRGLLEIRRAAGPDGVMHAGAVFLTSFREYIFLFSATDAVGREQGSMSRIIHSFISSHAGEERVLDFEGSMNPAIARFYKSFGSKEIVYLQIRKNTLPVIFRRMKK